MTVQYYNPATPSLITCNTNSVPIVNAAASPNVLNLPSYYYYINLGGQVQDPTCQQYAPGAMVCQRWTPNTCARTEVAAVYNPTTSTPSWTYVNGANYTSGIQLTLSTAPPVALTHTGASQLACQGTVVRILFVCGALSLHPFVTATLSQAASADFRCTFTFTISTYLVCAAPGAALVPAPQGNSVTCGATLSGTTYDLNPLSLLEISAYSNGTQYILHPCGTVVNPFCQGTEVTYQSQICAIPQICTTANSAQQVPITSVAGIYNASTAIWTVIPGGVQQQQATGQSCTAVCQGQTVYSGPMQSIVNFMCSTSAGLNSNASVVTGSYNPTTCAPINGGSCTVTFTTYTTYACASNPTLVSFNAITTSAPWEARANMGYSLTVSPITYTAVGASSTTTLPAGSIIVYGGQNELPKNPNNGSSTFVSPEFDVWATTDGVSWGLIGGYTLGQGNGGFSSIPGAVSVSSTAVSQGLPSFTEGQNSMKVQQLHSHPHLTSTTPSPLLPSLTSHSFPLCFSPAVY